jgi:hypothetical protein
MGLNLKQTFNVGTYVRSYELYGLPDKSADDWIHCIFKVKV